jgi:cellulose synthase/poly-beta-1,6-N-acetylglucosamine synthase-like glycosyltransferase
VDSCTTLIFLVPAVLYFIMIIVFTAGFRRLENPPEETDSFSTRVTVIVPVRNEENTIASCLEGLIRQDLPAGLLEIIIADDRSDDRTADVVKKFIQDHPSFPIRLIGYEPGNERNSSKKAVISRAVNQSTGTLIVTTDADTFRGPQWLPEIVRYYEAYHPGMILGPVAFGHEKSPAEKMQSLEFAGLMGATAGTCGMGIPVMCNGANLAYERKVFLEAGGYHSNMKYPSGDDLFLMSAIRKKYGKHAVQFLWSEKAIVTTGTEPTFRGFLNQRIRWVSKSRGYRDARILSVALLTYLVNLVLLGGLIAGIFDRSLLLFTIILVVAKGAFELPLVFYTLDFLGKRHLLFWYPLVQLIDIVYVTVIGILGLFLPYRWKGRKIKH